MKEILQQMWNEGFALDENTALELMKRVAKWQRERDAEIALHWGYTFSEHRHLPWAHESNWGLRVQNIAIAKRIRGEE